MYYFLENCINIPLITGCEHTPIIKYIPPPELHLLLGVVQRIFDFLKRDVPEAADEWIKRAGVKLDHYQKFNGNNARKLLKKVDLLRTICPGI